MTIDEMIKKFRIEIGYQNGIEGIRVYGKPGKRQLEEIKTSKPQIMEELKKRTAEAEAKREAELEEKRKQREKAINRLLSGKLKIKLQYHDGEYLSGYETTGEGCSQADELLEKLEVAHYVSGWGTIVDDKIVKTFGEEFTYQQVEEYAKPILEEKEKNIKQRELKEKMIKEEKLKEAKRTEKPIELDRYIVNCDKTVEDCSVDVIVIYILPDGTEKQERIHTY